MARDSERKIKAEKEVVIVTGSSGFIGASLINKLAGRFALVGFDRAAVRQPPPAAECVCIDLTSEKAIAAALQRVRTAYGARVLPREPIASMNVLTCQGLMRLGEDL